MLARVSSSTATGWSRPTTPKEMFGFPRLRTLVAEHDEEEHSLVDFLIEELYSFVAEGWEQEDDITLVTLGKIGGTLTTPSSRRTADDLRAEHAQRARQRAAGDGRGGQGGERAGVA